MRSATRLLLFVQVCLLIALVPVASASPPDPVWIAGIYDLADLDDVLGTLLDDEPAIREARPATDGHARTSLRVFAARVVSRLGIAPLDACRPRSPPSA